ncbi:hypothetical protein [Roseicyclus sp.]|uniref:hypothetical protein n=1 Tax=Roseicyclus sp. TaxID=1914329 RepID=UPI003F695989
MSEEGDSAKNSFGLLYWPGNATLCTRALYLFLSDYRKAFDYLFFVVHLAGRADEVRTSAAKTLYEISDDDEKKKKYEETIKSPDVMIKQWGGYAGGSVAQIG